MYIFVHQIYFLETQLPKNVRWGHDLKPVIISLTSASYRWLVSMPLVAWCPQNLVQMLFLFSNNLGKVIQVL